MSYLDVFSDAAVVAKRNLIKIKRVPDLLVFTTLSPIMFVLLFAYVFGGAIDPAGGGGGYREFLIAGIFAQTVVFGATITGAGLADDVKKGHHRPLPFAADGALGGTGRAHPVRRRQQRHRARGHVAHRVGGGLADPHLGAGGAVGLRAAARLRLRHLVGDGLDRAAGAQPEVVNNASFIVIFPLTFVANTFVPLGTLPGPLRAFAEWNPVSAVTQAARNLFGNPDPNSNAPAPTAWSLVHPELYTLLWAAAVLLIFVPLANAQYRRSTSR